MNWRKISEEKPEDKQECLTNMKHGLIQGTFIAEEGYFEGYYFTTFYWYAEEWLPIEECE